MIPKVGKLYIEEIPKKVIAKINWKTIMAMEIARISTKFQLFYIPYVLEGPWIFLRKKVIGLARWRL